MWNGLADCYEQGLVRAVGVSNYGAKQLKKVHGNFASRGVPLSSAQVGKEGGGICAACDLGPVCAAAVMCRACLEEGTLLPAWQHGHTYTQICYWPTAAAP